MCLKQKQARSSGKLPALLLQGSMPQTSANDMIYFVSVQLKNIFEQGKNYPWVKPEICPACGHYKVWGHGFTARYFRGFPRCLYLKCYRCPGCLRIITLRPDTHFSRLRSSRETIRSHLEQRQAKGRWPRSSLSRSCLRHWLANLTRQTSVHLGCDWQGGFVAAFDWLIAMGKTPVSRII